MAILPVARLLVHRNCSDERYLTSVDLSYLGVESSPAAELASFASV